jgi:hypothetical protein
MREAVPSCSWPYCRREKLTHENSDASRFVKFPGILRTPGTVDNVRILSPRSFLPFIFFSSLDINIINIRVKTDTEEERRREERLYVGVLGFKMIGVKLG